MDDRSLDDLMDQLVAEYSDRVAAGEEVRDGDLLERVPMEQRQNLGRCFRMIQSGLASAPSASRPLGPGTVMDGYRLVREIGRGGMSVVYEAIQEDLERRIALKVLRPGLALERRHVDRFRREALAIARLQHPNIVQVYTVGEALGHHYIAMELVDGKSLAAVLEALPKDRAWTAMDLADAVGAPALGADHESYHQAFCALMTPIARAIGVAHELGIVHRDVKPSNILIHKDGRPVIADFGLAKGDGDPGLSLSGEPIGTPFYMSPEQAAVIESPVDERTDVYSLGVTLYEGLTGRRPFEGPTVLAVIDSIRHRTPPSVRSLSKGLTRDVDAVVRRAMAKYPEDRYSTAIDLSSELNALAQGLTTRAAAREGGPVRRFMRLVKHGALVSMTGYGYEYRSERTFLGLPLVHINMRQRRPGQLVRRAKGWFAVGDVAVGFVACGSCAIGVFGFGALAIGGLCWAGIGVGIAPFAGLSLGVLATGGLAAGYAAIGGLAYGYYAHGGAAYGVHASAEGAQPDAAAQAFFETWMPWF